MSNHNQQTFNALALHFDHRNALNNLETVLADPLLKILFRGALSGPIANYNVNLADIFYDHQWGRRGFRLNQTIAEHFWEDLKRTAYIIHCAGNDYNPYTNPHPISMDIPTAALDEISLSLPTVSLALVYDLNPLLDIQPSKDDVITRVEILKAVGCYFINWLTEAARRSIKKGEDSLWNFEAFWGLSRKEFMARARKGYVGGEFDELRGTVEPNQRVLDHPLASLIKGDDSALTLRLTDGVTSEIRIVDPMDALIVADCVESLTHLTINADEGIDLGGDSD